MAFNLFHSLLLFSTRFWQNLYHCPVSTMTDYFHMASYTRSGSLWRVLALSNSLSLPAYFCPIALIIRFTSIPLSYSYLFFGYIMHKSLYLDHIHHLPHRYPPSILPRLPSFHSHLQGKLLPIVTWVYGAIYWSMGKLP